VKEAHRIGKRVFDQHPLGIADDQLRWSGTPIIDQELHATIARILEERLPEVGTTEPERLIDSSGKQLGDESLD
jgi:hypothetical protein